MGLLVGMFRIGFFIGLGELDEMMTSFGTRGAGVVAGGKRWIGFLVIWLDLIWEGGNLWADFLVTGALGGLVILAHTRSFGLS